MRSLIRTAVMTGVGLVVLTKDKVEELANEVIKEGKLSEKEGEDLIKELKERSQQAQKSLEEKVEAMVREATAKLDVATKDDIAQLKAKIERLERQQEQGTGDFGEPSRDKRDSS